MNKALEFTTLIAYLLGSIPFGYLLVRIFQGADIALGQRQYRATNVAAPRPRSGWPH